MNSVESNLAFVIGNGISRKNIDLNSLSLYGKIYGCNALYRDFDPDYLVAVDLKMIDELEHVGYLKKGNVWTNYNNTIDHIHELNFFEKGQKWSSGPSALKLASDHSYDRIYILGFDFVGTNNGKFFNNVYANTKNYKKDNNFPIYYGNWLKQTKYVISKNKDIKYIRVIEKNGFNPKILNELENYFIEDIQNFKNQFNF